MYFEPPCVCCAGGEKERGKFGLGLVPLGVACEVKNVCFLPAVTKLGDSRLDAGSYFGLKQGSDCENFLLCEWEIPTVIPKVRVRDCEESPGTSALPLITKV